MPLVRGEIMVERTTTDLLEEIEGEHNMSPGLLTERLLHGFTGHSLAEFEERDVATVKSAFHAVLSKQGLFPQRPEAVEMADLLKQVRARLDAAPADALSPKARELIRANCNC
jgi:hypothetical protein